MVQTTGEWVHGFVSERIACLSRGDFPVKSLPISPGTLVIHVVPTLDQYSLAPLQMAHCGLRPPRISVTDATTDHSFGFLAYSDHSYSLLFHTGATESVVVFPFDTSKQPTPVYGREVEKTLKRAVENSVTSIHRCKVEDPLLVCIRLLNMADAAVVDEHNNSPWQEIRAYGQACLELTPFPFERDESGRSPADRLDDALKHLW